MIKPKHKRPIRIQVTDSLKNVSFIVVDVNGSVRYFSSSEVPLALSNFAGAKAARLRFDLEDVRNEDDALKLVKAVAGNREGVVLL